MTALLPTAAVLDLLERAYGPCPSYANGCGSLRWAPADGYVPRGFLGAVGDLSEVELVMVVAEPGDPQPDEVYDDDVPPRELLEQACKFVYECFERSPDRFHQNVRGFLGLCWPSLSFDAQLRRVWITESMLCSAAREGGYVPARAWKACAENYLEPQLKLFPNALVAAFGVKAQRRVDSSGGIRSASALAPPGCNFPDARASWQAVAREVRDRRAGFVSGT